MRRGNVELTTFVFLLFAVPAHLVVPGFGAAGAPASLVGLLLLGLLVLGWMFPMFGGPTPARPRFNPVIIGLTAYSAIVLVTWVGGKSRPLSSLASTTSDRALITIASLLGVALFVIGRVRTAEAAIRLVDLMLAGAVFMCVVGLIQFFTGHDLSDLARVPGLVRHRDTTSIDSRSVFRRPAGTALHPIEFGVVSGAMIPLAWWRANRGRYWHWAALCILAVSAMTSLSRSAILTVGVGGLVLFVTSSWRDRLNLAVGGVVLVLGAGAAVPGLVGTLRSLFTRAGDDPSIQSRLARTPEVLRLVVEYPWLGRGFGTFTPEEYLLLDNEIQKMAIETGVVGVAVFLLFILTVVWTASVLHVDPAGTMGGLSAALVASILGIVLSYYTFDAFFYHILTGVLFLNIGLVGALWGAAREEGTRVQRTRAPSGPEPRSQIVDIDRL